MSSTNMPPAPALGDIVRVWDGCLHYRVDGEGEYTLTAVRAGRRLWYVLVERHDLWRKGILYRGDCRGRGVKRPSRVVLAAVEARVRCREGGECHIVDHVPEGCLPLLAAHPVPGIRIAAMARLAGRVPTHETPQG